MSVNTFMGYILGNNNRLCINVLALVDSYHVKISSRQPVPLSETELETQHIALRQFEMRDRT